MTTGQIIRAYRDKMSLSQEDLSSFLCIKREMVSYYENDTREVPREILEKLSNLFGIDLSDFFEEDEAQIKANVAFAFRANEIVAGDLNGIAEFRKIVKNYFKLIQLENL